MTDSVKGFGQVEVVLNVKKQLNHHLIIKLETKQNTFFNEKKFYFESDSLFFR